MKQFILFGLSFLLITGVKAQKKPTPKNAANPTPAAQKTPASKDQNAMQSMYLVTGNPESFKKLAVDARSQFDAGKLDDSRFALQQMLAELDMIIGKEVLKALPASLMDKAAVTKQDNVSGATGWLGVIIHREYGTEYSSTSSEENKNISVEILSNSPLVSSLNTMLSLPLGLGSTGDNKIIKVAGYKALITKSGSDNDKSYELQLPLGSSLITVKAPGATEDQVAQIASKLPVDQIAKMLQ